MTRTLFQPLLFGGLLLSFLAPAQTIRRPDFSGRWRMQKQKSDFAGFTLPDGLIRVVDEHGVVMNVHTIQTITQKTTITDISYAIDGSVTQNVINGREAESKSFWDGGVLVIKTTMKTSQGLPEMIEDRWSLTDDKQTLTIASHVETGKGGADLTMVCSREKR